MENEQVKTPVTLSTARVGILRAVRLETVLPRSLRHNMLASFFFLTAFLFFLWLVSLLAGGLFLGPDGVRVLHKLLGGVTLIVSGPLWFFIITEFYFLTVSRSEPLLEATLPDGSRFFSVNYGAARRLWHLDAFRKLEVDIARLYRTMPGDSFMQELFLRLGIEQVAVKEFIEARQKELRRRQRKKCQTGSQRVH